MSAENPDWGGRWISAGVGFVFGALVVAVPTLRQIAHQDAQLRHYSQVTAGAQARLFAAEKELRDLAAKNSEDSSRVENEVPPAE